MCEKICEIEQYDRNLYTDDSIQDNHVMKTVPSGAVFSFHGEGVNTKILLFSRDSQIQSYILCDILGSVLLYIKGGVAVKKRFISVATGLLVTLTALFGGFFAHQWWAIEQPIKEVVAETPHITLQSFDANPNRVEIKLKPDPDFSLAVDYPVLRQRLEEIVGERELSIQLIDHPSPKLQKIWDQVVFGVSEGIVHQRYTEISDVIQSTAEQEKISYELTMDDEFIYISLQEDPHFIYRVFPLHSANDEVKENG